MFHKKKMWKNFIALLMVLNLLLGFSSFLTPGTASAAEISVTIIGNGVENEKTFTLAELEAMRVDENKWVEARLYSSINTWPTKKWYAAEGVKLAKLLEEAGIKDEAKLITVKSRDGYRMTFTKKQLLDDERYYFPGLKENHEYFGQIPGSTDKKELVDTILALRSVDSDNLDGMNDKNAPLLVFGQRWVTEQTNQAFAKYVSEIEVTTTDPEKWDAPAATPSGGTVPVGTLVELSSPIMDADKIYYTTDDTDPSYKSPMYNWIASRWWSSRSGELAEINHPIEITADTTIKAVTIGIGKEDSDIVTFKYQVPGLEPAPEITADSTDNMVGNSIELAFADDEVWRNAITEVLVNDSTVVSDKYAVTAGQLTIDASVFAAAGDYTVKVKAAGYQDAIVTQTMVAAPTVFTVEGNAVPEVFYTMAKLKAMPTTTKNFGTYECKGVDFKYLLESLSINDTSWTLKIKTKDFPSGISMDLSYALDPTNNCLLTYEGDGSPVTSGPLRLYHGDGSSSKQNYKYVVGIIVTKPDTLASPVLTADSTDNTVGNPIELTFTDDEAWRNAITEVTVNASAIASDKYAAVAGKLTIDASVFTTAGDYTIVVKATGYENATVTQTMVAAGPRTWYVDGAGSADFTTIQAAVTAASAGDTIIVKDGTYTENVTVDKALTIRSENGAPSTTVEAAVYTTPVFDVDASGVVINGFSVLGPTDTHVAGIELVDVNDCTIQNNDCSGGCYNGIHLGGTASNNIVTGNHCHGNSRRGISIRDTAHDNFILRNTVENNTDAGFCIKDQSKDNVLWLNNIIGNRVEILTANTYHSPDPLTYTYNGTSYTGYLGNYWDSYDGIDADGNGIGETPYSSGTISDDYPLMDLSSNYVEVKTWYVDGSGGVDFTTIQAAVDAANDGDIIIVKDGTYNENVVVDKSLVIQSENGADLTTVQAANTNADVFKVIAENVIIDGFTVSGATSTGRSGIYITSSSGSSTVINNHCSGNFQGIYIGADGNTVSNNTCTCNGRYGIHLSKATGNSITDNTCANNTDGSGFALYLADNANNNTVSGNTSHSNKYGIRVKNAYDNLIFNNTSLNNDYGLEIATGSTGNVFYLNNFIGNTSELSLGYGAVAGNSWNSPTEMPYSFNGTQYNGFLGNYWSNYTGVDADNNGIGDTPYQTVQTDNDNYPLMGQWDDGTITAPVAAQILLSCNSGIPGVTTFITGSGFDADTAGTIWFDTNDNGALDDGEPSVAVNTDADGAIPLLTSLTVPSASTGSYNVRADIDGIEATAGFTITNSGIIVSPTCGNNRVSFDITITGSGFAPNTSFRLFCDRNGNGIFDDGASRTGKTAADGTLSVSNLSWPPAQTGIYNFLLDLNSDNNIEASASVCVIPGIKIDIPRGFPETNISMYIDGFQANATGYVWFDTNGNRVWDEGENRASVTTSGAGTATTPGLYVPSAAPGDYQVCAEIPACGLKASATYSITGMVLNPSSGTAGTEIDITGYGYVSNQESGRYIWFDTDDNGTWDADEPRVDVTTDANGTLSPVSLTAPAVPAGSYNVRANVWPSGTFAVFTLNEAEEPGTPPYNLVPVEDAVYTIGETADGIKTMTVNPNQTGLKYFTVTVEPIEPHEGTETVVFTHLEDDIQLQLNALVADFDEISAAKAGFNVNPSDVIKVYIVDRLTNDPNYNPLVLQ
ncbi:MAG: hemoblobin-interacting domain-containing protein [Dethiobacteria bacterium]|jgi:parallel beta-helix repeat protein